MSCSGYRGTRAFLSAMRAMHHLDDSQARSVYHAARRKTRAAAQPPTVRQWQALVDQRLDALAVSDGVDSRVFDRVYRFLQQVRDEPPTDALTYAALRDLPPRAAKAAAAIRRQVDAAAALRGATPAEVQERFNAYRDQYLRDYRGLPADQRPDPPAEWVNGFCKKDTMAVSAPGDKATLYAMYRCQADPTAFPANPDQRFASIDLETAGPSGKDGFVPANGSIIEVGIAEYDAHGNEVASYSQLVRPSDEALSAYGTGAVNVHHIEVADLDGAPSWTQVAPQVAGGLDGRVRMAQNARYERDWLTHHMAAESQPFQTYAPTVDTMTVAKQHFSFMPSHRLGALCERFGVPYTNGHRALHDAQVTAMVFFRMRDRIFAQWGTNLARARVPQPPDGAGLRQRTSQLQRMSGGAFDPSTVEDPWAGTAPPQAA